MASKRRNEKPLRNRERVLARAAKHHFEGGARDIYAEMASIADKMIEMRDAGRAPHMEEVKALAERIDLANKKFQAFQLEATRRGEKSGLNTAHDLASKAMALYEWAYKLDIKFDVPEIIEAISGIARKQRF